MFDHLQAAFWRRLGVADQGECPLVLDLGLIVVDGVGGFATKVKDTKWSVDSFWMLRRLGVAEECPLVLDPGLNVVGGVGGSTSKWFCR